MRFGKQQKDQRKWLWFVIGLICAVSVVNLVWSGPEILTTENPTQSLMSESIWRLNFLTPTPTLRIRICDCILAQVATRTPTPTLNNISATRSTADK